MTMPCLFRLPGPSLDPAHRNLLATGRAGGVVVPFAPADQLSAVARAVRQATANATPEPIPPLIVTPLETWRPASGPAFDVAAQLHDLTSGGEPLDAMLAALATGQALAAAGINAVIGPDLADSAAADPEAVDALITAMVEGLQAAGVVVALRDSAPVALPVELTDARWRPWSTAFSAGLEWALADPSLAEVLRHDLAFGGLVMADGRPVRDETVDSWMVEADAVAEPTGGRELDEAARRWLQWRLDVLD